MKPEDITTNLRLAAEVRRFHTWPVLRQQTIAEHSWQVLRIYEALWGWPSPRLTRHIQYHDCGEIVTGDLPYPTKSLNPELKRTIDLAEKEGLAKMGIELEEITVGEHKQFKLAHLIEMFEYGLEELCMGNTFAEPVASRCKIAALDMAAKWYPERQWLMGNTVFEKTNCYIEKMERLFDRTISIS